MNAHSSLEEYLSAGFFKEIKGDKRIVVVEGVFIHSLLGIRIQYSTWVRKTIKEFSLEQGVDFYRTIENTRKLVVITYFTLEVAKGLTFIRRTSFSAALRKRLREIERLDTEFPEVSVLPT
jgi:phage anti-repressor protein